MKRIALFALLFVAALAPAARSDDRATHLSIGDPARRDRQVAVVLDAVTDAARGDTLGVERVATIDWDVHHGNGSQDIFWRDPSVMYCSTHQMPLFPGTGAAGERGEHDTVVNAPLAPGDGGAKFRSAFENLILPQLEKFSPELVVISAGFDAHHRDPLASINLTGEDFGWVTQKLMDLADKTAGGRVVSVLEGGYDLEAIARSTAFPNRSSTSGRTAPIEAAGCCIDLMSVDGVVPAYGR